MAAATPSWVIPRSTWGARPPRSRVVVNWPRRGILWLHHTDGSYITPEDPERPGRDYLIVWVGANKPNLDTIRAFVDVRYPGKRWEVRERGPNAPPDERFVVVIFDPDGPSLMLRATMAAASATQVAALERAAMRQLQAFHMGPQRGWADIGYGYVVFPSGRMYEGRGFEVQAAHRPGENSEPSVSMAGDYGTRVPTDRMVGAVTRLQRDLGRTVIRGHRQRNEDGRCYGTSCPGNAAVRRFGLGAFDCS